MFGSIFHFLFNLSVVLHLEFSESFNIHTKFLILPNFKAIWWTLTCMHEQILHFFIIYFEHRYRHLELFLALYSCFFDSLKYFLTRHWHNPPIRLIPNHRIRFPSPCLPISKQTAIKPIPISCKYVPSTCYYFFTKFLKNSFLINETIINRIQISIL